MRPFIFRCIVIPVFLTLIPGRLLSFDLESYAPPISGAFEIDTHLENPPVNSHITSVARPKSGGTIPIQVFLPQAIGQRAFSFLFEFDDPTHDFADYFRIVNAHTWVRYPVQNAQGQTVGFTLVKKQITAPAGSTGVGKGILFVAPPLVPPDGLLAELTLEAKRDIPASLEIHLRITAAILSTTPPERLWKYEGDRRIYWQ